MEFEWFWYIRTAYRKGVIHKRLLKEGIEKFSHFSTGKTLQISKIHFISGTTLLSKIELSNRTIEIQRFLKKSSISERQRFLRSIFYSQIQAIKRRESNKKANKSVPSHILTTIFSKGSHMQISNNTKIHSSLYEKYKKKN